MDQNQPELTFEESVKQVMQTLPPVIRDYLAQGKYTPVAQNMMTKYGLRIDQGGVLEREIMLLLMGIETPDEFTKALVEEARLGQEAVGGIVQDINAQIFVPLREEEMKQSKTAAVSTPPPTPKPASVPLSTGPQTYAPPLQSPRYQNQPAQQDLSAFIRPVQRPPVNAVRPASPNAPFRPATPAPASQSMQPTSKPLDASKLLEDHEEPHIEFHKAQQGGAQTPLGQVLRSVMPPANLPGAVAPHIIPAGGRPTPISAPRAETPATPIAPKPVPSAPPVPAAVPAPAPAAPQPPTLPRTGGADPYREPIEP
jgi:hypothetical protein